MLIRTATEADVKKAAQCYENLFEYEQKNGSFSNWKAGLYPVEKTALDAFDNNWLFVLEDENGIAASMILNSNQAEEYKNIKWRITAAEDQVLVIHTLCVSPEKKGLGYGKKMVNFAVEYAKKQGFKTIRIDTWKNNIPAQKLYIGQGFELLGEQHVLHAGVINEVLVYLDKIL